MEFLRKKALGFYFMVFAALSAVIALAKYLSWSSEIGSINTVVTGALLFGLAVNIILFFKDNDYLVIIMTAFYSISVFQLISNSVGSFVDAFQGIVMFGDSTQVGTILSISYFIIACAIASIFAGFMKRIKE